MTQTIKYDSVTGAGWTTTLGTVKAETCRWVEAAYLGEVGSGAFTVSDVDGTAGHSSDAIVGLKTIRVTQTAAPAGKQYIFTGYVGPRTYRRGSDEGIIGVAREIDVTCTDINDALGFWAFEGAAGKRPRESVGARVTWLLTTSQLPASDNGLVVYPTTMMDVADYQNRTPADVLADCANLVGFNYFLRWDGTALGPVLAFYDPNTSTLDTSTTKISNVAADVSGTTVFAPLIDSALTRSPARVASRIGVPWSGGTEYVNRPATAVAFANRTHIATNADSKSAATALLAAQRLVYQDSTEEDQLSPVTIQVPAANVNDILAGQRLQVKLSHLPGYESYTWCRVLRRTVSQPQTGTDEGGAVADWYEIVLELTPQETFPTCTVDLNGLYGTVTDGGSDHQYNCGGPDSFWGWTNPSNANDSNLSTYALTNAGVTCVGNYGPGGTYTDGTVRRILRADLGAPRLINSHIIRSDFGGATGTIEYSSDGTTWTNAPGSGWVDLTEPLGEPAGSQYTLTTPTTARYWRNVITEPPGSGYRGGYRYQTWGIIGCPP